ncbi:sensor histidine kinase [Dactylosporangium sp. CA-139066]|uniref:sensor histidine kinase n=1 Tax=Dactylosporangium sp. CA-139066 TaxID=3239930 RepID=UPI003D9295B5
MFRVSGRRDDSGRRGKRSSAPTALRRIPDLARRAWALLPRLLPAVPPPAAFAVVVAALLIAAETVVLYTLRGVSGAGQDGEIYLLGVLIMASVWGVAAGVATAAVSTLVFNYFLIPPAGLHLTVRRDLEQAAIFMIAAIIVSGIASLARSRAVEASQRKIDADFGAELARRTLSADDVPGALTVASQRLAELLRLPYASIEFGDSPAGEGDTVLPLFDQGAELGVLRLPASTPPATLQRVRERMVPSLEAVLRAARDRERILTSLRASEREATKLLVQQAALRRVATLVAAGAPPAEVFAAVTLELCRLFDGIGAALMRYEADGIVRRLSGCDESGHPLPPADFRIEGNNLVSTIIRTRRNARLDDFETASGSLAAAARALGIRSAVGVPVVVEGELWGVTVIMSSRPEPIPGDAEDRVLGFTDLVATAIANADNRAQLIASRARLVTTADEARRKIERDLHDGAQQRLVSLALELRMAADSVPDELPAVRSLLRQGVQGLNDMHNSLRELGRGIHPALASQGGLAPALKSLARRSSLPVELSLDIGQRPSERVEVAAYFVVSEALANAAKHSRASVVLVSATADTARIRLSVRDDGIGGADASRGTGLVGLRDRVEALGGRLMVVSPPGLGTALTAEIPLEYGELEHADVDMLMRRRAPGHPAAQAGCAGGAKDHRA